MVQVATIKRTLRHHEISIQTHFPIIRIRGVVVAIIIAVLSWRYFGTGSDNNTSGAQQSARGQDTSHGGRRNTPLAPVQAATATEQEVPRYLTGLGTVIAANTVTVTSRVDGELMALHFTEGQQVKAGDLLAEIDPALTKSN